MIKWTVLFAVIFVFLSPVAATAEEGIGIVRTLSGSALIIRGDQEIPAKKDMLLFKKDAIETAEKSSIGITFHDNTVFSLGPDSAIEIQDYFFDSGKFKGRMDVNMKKGTMTAVSGDIPKGSPEAMKINTPTAVLAVRGTRFVVKVDSEE